MIMETISYGYPVAPTGLGGSPLSPPSSPPGTESYAPQLYAQTQYVEPAFANTQLLHSSYSKYEEDANNNNHIYNSNDALNNNNNSSSSSRSSSSSSSDSDSLLSDLSSMSITEPEERFSDLSTVSEYPDYLSEMSPPTPPSLSSSRPKPKKNSRSKSKSSVGSEEGDKSRKDSFVYDVRLPDEQILLFVPDLDLVKSHLMFAVREEVDVLKDRIVELMDRIKHLECENTILRQYASPEVLQQIQSQMPHQLQQPSHHSSTS